MNRSAWVITLIYFAVSILWITFSDKILLSIESDPFALSRLQSYKGWVFVFLSAVLIYFLTSNSIKKFILTNKQKTSEIKYLSEIKNKLQLSIDAGKIGFWEWNLKTNKVYFSKEWKRQIGLSDKEIPNNFDEWEKRVHPDDLKKVKTNINRFIKGETTDFYSEFRFKHKNGHYIWILANASVIKDKKGKIEKLLGTHLDITSRKKVEEELKEKEKQLSNLIGNLKGVVYRCKNDANWTMIFLSKGIEEITGYRPEELINNKIITYADLIHPDDIKIVGKEIQKAINYGKQFQITYPIKTKNNEQKWVWEQGIGVYDEKGQLKWLEGYIADITEQKLAEIALQQSEKKYKDLVENALVGIYSAKFNGQLIFANNAFCEILGYNNIEELKNKDVKKLYPSIEVREDFINQLKLHKSISNYNIVLLTKQGEEKHITLSATLNGDEISGMMMDMTHIKEYEKQILTAKEEAEKSSKIKDVFIGNISHEIRTPLNAINGFTNILKSKFEQHIDDKTEEFFQIIFDASTRLERTVDMMLDYAKLNASDMEMKPHAVDLIQITKKILAEHQVEIQKKSLEIKINQKTENTQIIADAYAIENALSNIVQNAVKYTEKGYINITLTTNENYDTIIDVEDTGVGIADEYLDDVFAPYSQEESGYTRQYEGIGLGLSITKKLLELNGAEITVTSSKGKGSVFSILFSNDYQQQIKENPKPQAFVFNKKKIPGNKKTSVLIVEDDPSTQQLLKNILKDEHQIYIADSAENALQVLEKNTVNLILMDISLKESTDGLELTRQIKHNKMYEHIPIISVTAHVSNKIEEEAYKAGCVDYITKPFDIKTFYSKISGVLSKN